MKNFWSDLLSRILSAIALLALSGCNREPAITESSLFFCIAAEHDEDLGPLSRGETRTLSSLGPDMEIWEEPERFTRCAEDARSKAQLVDENGERLWLALDASLEDEELLPEDFVAGLAGSTMNVRQTGGFLPFTEVDFIRNGLPDIVLLRSTRFEPRMWDEFFAELGGASGPPRLNECGTAASMTISISDAEEMYSLAARESLTLSSGAGDWTATHFGTTDYQGGLCEDHPQGVSSSFVLVREDTQP